jgi:hypothetical protein
LQLSCLQLLKSVAMVDFYHMYLLVHCFPFVCDPGRCLYVTELIQYVERNTSAEVVNGYSYRSFMIGKIVSAECILKLATNE